MSVLEFISAVIGSLAWPAVIGVAVVVMRKQIRDLATRLVGRFAELTELSGMGVSFKFDQKLNKLEQDVRDIKSESDPVGTGSPDQDAPETGAVTPDTGGTDTRSPSEEPLVTFLEAYRVVELAAWRALDRHGIGINRRRPSLKVALKLLMDKTSHRDSSLVRIVDELVQLRNAAVHEGARVERDDADRYTWIANDIAEFLNDM